MLEEILRRERMIDEIRTEKAHLPREIPASLRIKQPRILNGCSPFYHIQNPIRQLHREGKSHRQLINI
jgi:hypothetical protein